MSLVNPKQYIISARSNGYKDTAYAIAELTDNSIQAGADKVEIVIFENKNRSIDEIAIVDNGSGMSKERLASALGFGESGRDKDKEGNLLNDDVSGMGKFGMGLPNASISQCKRVEVWSWQSIDEIYYSYLDVDEIIAGNYFELPLPTNHNIPQKYISTIFTDGVPSSGTIVIWSKLDKLKWKRSVTLFDKSQFEIGRMYRRFISNNQCSVQFKVFDCEGSEKIEALKRLTSTGFIKANDPLYLTPDSSLPALPYLHADEEKTFFLELQNFSFSVTYQDVKHDITIKSSCARTEMIHRILSDSQHNQAGKTDFGKHCFNNFGLSVMRANREIELITNEFFIKDDPYKARFMGVEIDIPPALDEVFGVTNNKQHAHNLKEINLESIDAGGQELKNIDDVINYLRDNNDEEQAILYEVSSKLSKVITDARKHAKALPTTKIQDSNEEVTEDDKVSIVVNSVLNKRDTVAPGKALSEDPDYGELKLNLIERHGHSEEDAIKIVKKMEQFQSRISVQYSKTSNHSFFEVESIQGLAVLVINPEHELYVNFLSQMTAKDKMIFKVILGAWAIMEDSTTLETKKRQLERARNDWGEVIEDMLEELDL